MKFSVLMSLYNKENPSYLDQCFQSLYIQTLPASEIVLVFDGPINADLLSTVSLWEKKLPIKVIKLESNVGLSKALNYGLKYCAFDLVARMDTDDICCRNRFEKQIQFMQSHQEVALLGAAIEEFDETMSKSLGVRFSRSEYDDIKKYCVVRNPFNHMSVVFRKRKIIEAGGYIDHPFMEDYNLWLRVIARGEQVYNINEVLVFVRTGESMIERRRGLSYVKSEFLISELKVNINIDSRLRAFCILILRIAPRFLPTKKLSSLYGLLRNKREKI